LTRRRIVITGLGTINPSGRSVPEFWENCAAGYSAVRLVRNVDLGTYPIRIGGEVDLPPLPEEFPRKILRKTARFNILAFIAAHEAFVDSGLTAEEIAARSGRYGVVVGTGDGGVDFHHKSIAKVIRGELESVSAYYIVGHIPSTPSAFIASQFHFSGPNYSVNSACATSNHALGTAMMLIRCGLADVVLAGGTEAVVDQPGFAGFGNIGALSRRNDDPATASRPFDAGRDGFVLAEGAGVVCLEELEHARERGARIYAELKGFGFSCDAYDLVAPHPEGRGAVAAIDLAIADAGLNKDEIDLINAHGTSTPVGDLVECKALNRVFGADRLKRIPVHSTKSMTGHLIGASGAVQLIADIPALLRNVIHPSINVFEQDPQINFTVVKGGAWERPTRNVLSNNFAFGGQNAVVVISRFDG